jgi:hypothetical protein
MRIKMKIGFVVILLLLLGTSLFSAETAIAPEITKKVDSLFVIASSGLIKYTRMVQPAIDSIAALGAAAVPRLIEKYDTQDARERLTINNTLVKIGKPAVPYLLDALSLDNAEQVARICSTLGEIKDSSAVNGLQKISSHPDWRVRSEATGALGKIGDRRGDRTILNMLLDTVETVRKSAAVSAGNLAVTEALPLLVHMLGDSFYGARLCASEALAKFGTGAIGPIADSLDSADTLVGDLGCITLGMIGDDSSAVILETQLQSPMPLRRALASEAILRSNSAIGCGYIELLRPTETDSTVLFYMDKVLEKYAPR